MNIGTKKFDIKNRTYIMGILNVTPDSFYDGGRYNAVDSALFRAEEMLKEGADIIDIGGESTRPGHTQISIAEEIARVAPIIQAVKSSVDIPVSCDTYKAEVAAAAIEAGADMINDIWGFRHENNLNMSNIVAKSGTCCVLMHNKSVAEYQNFIPDVLNDLSVSLQIAQNAGISKDKIILDPGIGFGKTARQNLTCLAHIEQFIKVGYPLLIGASNKSFIGAALGLETPQRHEATLAVTAHAAIAGAAFVRVHDVLANKRVVALIEAIKASKEQND
ncbi:MAG: dihydropteroate synthase [Firmicutes bacterium]|nr:dihydropteroate synthase [Bacillota bacterium]